MSLGTSGAVFAATDVPTHDGSGIVAGFADATGRELPLACTLNAARVLTATATMLGTDLAGLDRLAAEGDPDAGGLTLLPYLDGERTPDLPEAAGSLHGLRRAAMTPAEPGPGGGARHALRPGRRARRDAGQRRAGRAGRADRRRLEVAGRAIGGAGHLRRPGRRARPRPSTSRSAPLVRPPGSWAARRTRPPGSATCWPRPSRQRATGVRPSVNATTRSDDRRMASERP